MISIASFINQKNTAQVPIPITWILNLRDGQIYQFLATDTFLVTDASFVNEKYLWQRLPKHDFPIRVTHECYLYLLMIHEGDDDRKGMLWKENKNYVINMLRILVNTKQNRMKGKTRRPI